nr:amidohydrolase family protein [Kaistia nematophila]
MIVTQDASNGPLTVIDFHVHIRPPWWRAPRPIATNTRDAAWQAAWVSKLTAPEALLRESAEAGVALNLLSSTIEGISGIRGPVDHEEVRRHNDYLAELATAHPGRLAALAAVDAFSGEAAALEAERAIRELGHVGIVIDSARDGVYAGHPSTWPVFEAADRLGVPILVHPVAAETTEALTRSAGRPGNSFGRGHVNGTAFLTVLENGIVEQYPDLDLVFTGIGLGALVIAAAELPQYSLTARERGIARPRIHFDFMGLDPAVLAFAVSVLGVDRVLVGSDWPIWEPVTHARLSAVFDAAGVAGADRRKIASGNAQRILARRTDVARRERELTSDG